MSAQRTNHAIYNGYSQHFHPLSGISAITHKYIHSDDYLFFLGNTDPKKNVPRTLKAYSLYLKRSSRKRPLLIAGLTRRTKLDMILREQHIEEIKPYLSYPGYISNKDLAYLYNGAFVFLYTSLRESFGIPMLEAMACGTPVITGNTSPCLRSPEREDYWQILQRRRSSFLIAAARRRSSIP